MQQEEKGHEKANYDLQIVIWIPYILQIFIEKKKNNNIIIRHHKIK